MGFQESKNWPHDPQLFFYGLNICGGGRQREKTVTDKLRFRHLLDIFKGFPVHRRARRQIEYHNYPILFFELVRNITRKKCQHPKSNKCRTQQVDDFKIYILTKDETLLVSTFIRNECRQVQCPKLNIKHKICKNSCALHLDTDDQRWKKT